MPNQTKNLGLNTFLENEVVDFEQINDNFEKIDSMVMCVESGTKTAAYTGGITGTAVWRYKKYSDGTIDMSTKLEFTNIKCNGGTEAPYNSGPSKIYFPIELTSVYDVQMHLTSTGRAWVIDITEASVVNHVHIELLSTIKETDYMHKQVFINVKGVLK